MAEKDTDLDLGNNSRSRSNCECINTSNNGNIIITESERFLPDKKECTSNIMNISKVSKTYAGNTASRSSNSYNSSDSNSHSVSVQSESMIGGVDLDHEQDLDLTHTLHAVDLDPDLEDGEQLEQSKRCSKSILHKETLDSHLSTQTHVMNTGQAESQSDPHLARKSLKGKHSLNSRFFKHIISGTSCVPSSSDLSMSIEADDDDIDNLSIDLNDDIVYTEADLKKAKVSNKASPNSSTLCWHCGSYASPTSSLSLSSSFEVDDDNFKSFDLPIFYFDSKDHLFPDWESDHSSTSSISHENMDDWADVDSMYDNLDDKFEEMRQKRSQDPPPLYPHRALLYLECSICLIKSYLRRRVCCDFQICHDCMSAYVSVKVSEAKVQIECPSDRCNVLVHRDEINERLPNEMRDKFAKFLIDANADPCEKTCPACSKGFSIKPETLAKKKKSKYGLKVTCGQCCLVWCFLCHAPYHTDITCKQYKKGNKMVKKWAKERSCGQSNAQKCPKCGIYIQRVHGCDHMKCTKCHTDFCYQCGDRYISIKLLGNHWSRFSPLGCKYRLMPKRPGLRKFIRGTNFAARVVAGVILAGLGLAAGVVLVGASVVIVPGYGIFMLKQHLWRKKQLKRFKKQKMEMIARAERERLRLANLPPPPLSSDQPMDVEPHIMEDLQQVKVMVHRSLSFSPEEAKDLSKDIIVNKYTTDNAELSIARETGDDSIHLFNFSEVVEVKNPNGYSTIVCNIVSKLGENAATHSSDFDSELLGNEEACIKGINNLSLQSGETDMDTKVIHCKSLSVTAHEYEVTETESGYDEGHEDTKCDSYKKTLLEMTNSQEKNNGCFSEYNKVNMSEVLVNDISDKDRGSIKDDSNGCFGNIFSKRIQNSVISTEDLFPKSQVPSFSRKFLSKKAATWEKCHCDKVKSLLKLNPQESKGDLNDSQSSTNNERTKQAMALLTGDETKNVISTNICVLDHSDISFRQRDSLPNDSTIQQDISYSMEQISYPAKAPPCLSSTTVAPDSTFGVDQQLDVKPKLESHFEEENVSQYTLVTYL
ncbi:uncharacterized protein DDB_G0292642-like [Biomphalaria glabrata]|uniref:RBR-type E3 ubiquitin transferase n=1 Tax=Biomphalaria glabrata TaxID=6526 RepID=A0A9U8E3F3_BIOGL|nr:uncharacterized protein DDB_G0292642-like [Biomphalaria glabrata]